MDLGSLEVGKLSDIVIVAGDPLQDIKAAADVQTVIVGGGYSVADLMASFPGK
jgi:imidazolonepropionase-like amidohydrolase